MSLDVSYSCLVYDDLVILRGGKGFGVPVSGSFRLRIYPGSFSRAVTRDGFGVLIFLPFAGRAVPRTDQAGHDTTYLTCVCMPAVAAYLHKVDDLGVLSPAASVSWLLLGMSDQRYPPRYYLNKNLSFV